MEDGKRGLAVVRVPKVANGDVGRLLSEVKAEQLEWLWPGRVPLGKLTVLDGDPGLGKSAMTLDIAARISVGGELPDGERYGPAGVVLLSAEDGLADTIRPRLDAAGADTKKIVAVSTVPDGKAERMISIPKDLTLVELAIRRVGAALVVVDPLMAFLSSDTNSHKDQDVRRALAPLAALAERTRAAVLIVRHLNKTEGGNSLYRGGGSIGIIGAARSGLVVAEDPEDPDRRVLAPNKNNLAKPAPSLVFGMGTAPNDAVRVIWHGRSDLSAAQILQPPVDEDKSALSEAKKFLRNELRDGPVAAKQVKKNAREADISERTLKRAKRELGVDSEKESDGYWTWVLPVGEDEEGQVPPNGPVGTLGPLEMDGPLRRAGSAHLSEEGQGGQGDHESKCIHNYFNGVGCYLCDPRHPHRLKQGGAA